VRIILGGPGCGKTTRLLDIMEEELGRGVSPERLAFVSFTKKAVGEAAARACEKFKMQPGELPYFRTIHSLAYRLLGIQQGEVMQQKHWRELGDMLGYEFTRGAQMDEGLAPAGQQQGDLLRFIDALARARCVPLEEQLRDIRDEVMPQELRRFQRAMIDYKQSRGLLDFTDLLERYVEYGDRCPVDVVIIDEAQDLSRAQWKVIKRAFAGAQRMYVGGDDDQAIFRWSGADIETFLRLKGEREVLATTHRLPRTIYGYSQVLVSRLSKRYEKTATPRDAKGSLQRVPTFDRVPIKTDGTWMLLVRNAYYLDAIKRWLYEEGVPYATHLGTSVRPEHLQAIIAWEKLRKGEALPVEQVRGVYDWMRVGKALSKVPGETMLTLADLCEKHGCKTDEPWHDALVKIPERDRVYYRACKRRGESLTRAPRIYVGTIHSVKGGEADHVAVLPSMTQRTWDSFERVPDDEHRAFYVAVTRARESLWLIDAGGTRSYSL